MKTTFLKQAVIIVFLVFNFSAFSQTTQATNAITSTSYLGTSNNFDVNFRRNNVVAGSIGATSAALGVNSFANSDCISLGFNAGQFSTTLSGRNVFIGMSAGRGQSATTPNTGVQNVFIGQAAGSGITTGSNNVFVGTNSGTNTTVVTHNVYFGTQSGMNNSGSSNVCIGSGSGKDSTGSNNVFIGRSTGVSEASSDKLFIDNTTTANPIIWGDFVNDQLKFNGKVGIGGNSAAGFGSFPTTAGSVNVSAYQLFVRGGILTEEIRVNLRDTNGWADYVFNKDYKLKSLAEVEQFIIENGHLPNVPSAKTVKEDGIELGEMAKIQQEKIEELTLYIIELNKKLEAQDKKMIELEKKINN
jgi:hypothetical protein